MTLNLDFEVVQASLEVLPASSPAAALANSDALAALGRIRKVLEEKLHWELYRAAQDAATADPGRVCDWCGCKGGVHDRLCNTETDSAPFIWKTDVKEWGRK